MTLTDVSARLGLGISTVKDHKRMRNDKTFKAVVVFRLDRAFRSGKECLNLVED